MSDDFKIPFDRDCFDRLLSVEGIDVVLVTSKHNIQYLLGGYRYFFFENCEALGISRYLPILIYPRGQAPQTAYLGNAQEAAEAENGKFWCADAECRFWTTTDVAAAAVKRLRRMGMERARIGIEFSFMPADAMAGLRNGLPDAEFVEAHLPLERLRATKTPRELATIREVSERVVDSMLATFAAARPGITKRGLFDLLREKEIERGLRFDFCQLTMGTKLNRSPNEEILRTGDIVSLDSGGSYGGYFGDMCRMGVVGAPDEELRDCLRLIDDIQLSARAPIRAGAIGVSIYRAVSEKIRSSSLAPYISFVAHGMGIIGHEAPRLSDAGPVRYPADDADLPLREGMVISIETTLQHPRRGFIKLEDTVTVTSDGHEAFADGGRGWNVIPE